MPAGAAPHALTATPLICPFVHHLITHVGYTVTLGEHGRVTWTAPAWLDPTRTPESTGSTNPHPCTRANPPSPAANHPEGQRAVTIVGVEQTSRLTAWVHGRVQGVGFRWWTRSRALELGLVGSATNTADGRVLVVAEGPRAQGEQLLTALRAGTSPGRVDLVVESWDRPRGGLRGFEER